MIKRILLSLVLCVSMLVPSQKANAGALNNDYGMVYLGFFLALVVPPVGLFLIILDSDGNPHQVPAEKALAQQFPFLLDQPEATHDLAMVLDVNVRAAAEVGGTTHVRIPESVTRGILEATNLNSQQVQEVVDSLK